MRAERDEMKAKLLNAQASNELALDKARLEKEIEMRKLIDAAYDKGYDRCKANLQDARQMMMTSGL